MYTMVCMVSPDCNTLVVCCFMYNSLNNTRNTIPYRYLIFVTEVGGERAIVFEMMYRLICFTALTLGIISSTDFRASEYISRKNISHKQLHFNETTSCILPRFLLEWNKNFN
ncbi:hypothetical protein DERF_014005 [Dermatophagoides farinae]|uniref:Uncharacterized protein n=1 Tax=Dermatophagoides farinae TaxID=6954 RepID=A0A922HNQ4_DERFA|nr:hypothetical protein DERF_014005 [Dermatophagoides farinae]